MTTEATPADRRATVRRQLVRLVTAALLLAACGTGDPTAGSTPDATAEPPTEPAAGDPTGPTTTTPAVDPTASKDPMPMPDRTIEPPAEDRAVPLGESFTLGEGGSAHVDGLRLTLLSASGPGDDCDDCPLQATVEVTHGGATERLEFSFSGNMAPGVGEEARTASVFDHTVRVDRVVDREADLTVTRT